MYYNGKDKFYNEWFTVGKFYEKHHKGSDILYMSDNGYLVSSIDENIGIFMKKDKD